MRFKCSEIAGSYNCKVRIIAEAMTWAFYLIILKSIYDTEESESIARIKAVVWNFIN